jgi:hypothetical protein
LVGGGSCERAATPDTDAHRRIVACHMYTKTCWRGTGAETVVFGRRRCSFVQEQQRSRVYGVFSLYFSLSGS